MKHTTTALAAIMIMLALAGCTGGVETDQAAGYQGMQGADCTELDPNFDQCVITMSDTRRVTCITYRPYKGGGIDCDWAHSDGADDIG